MTLAPRYNIAPSQTIPIVRRADAGNELAEVRWGLIPAWARDAKIGNRCINARVESLGEKPAFRDAWRTGRRCLVPATGFFEWARTTASKQPYLLRPRGGGLMAMAGLWETWRSPEGTDVETCTIVTTAANDVVRPLHDRMPMLVAPERFDAWLDPKTPAGELAGSFDLNSATALEAVPVSTLVNRPGNDDARCVEPVST